MLSEQQIKLIAQKANKKVDIPVIGERFEENVLVFGITKIDKALEEHLPTEFGELLDDVSDGLEPGSSTDLERIKKHLVTYLLNNVDVPILGKRGERELFNFTVGMIIDAMRKGQKLR
ncbi:MAG: hypothetical protein ACOC31_03230 [Bacteroidota bacterium]